MESELLIAMALVAAGAAAVGILLGARTWPDLRGHDVLEPVGGARAFQGRALWVCSNAQHARTVLTDRLAALSQHARVLYLPSASGVGAIDCAGVRRMRTTRPTVQDVVGAGRALSVFGKVVLVVEGLNALEAPGQGESSMAAIEELFELCSIPLAVVLTEDSELPEGGWSVERFSS